MRVLSDYLILRTDATHGILYPDCYNDEMPDTSYDSFVYFSKNIIVAFNNTYE